MSIYRSGDFTNIDRVQPIHGDHSEEDQQGRKRRRKVKYQGRSWAETEDDLPIDSTTIEESSKSPERDVLSKRSETAALYADKMILERAKKRLGEFVTLEEKVASLCFLEAEATYDAKLQDELEWAVQKDQIGGMIFTKGDFKRQSYLIEHLQVLSSTPLLIGNDFFHGLSFYFEGDCPLETLQNKMDEKRFADLGKAVVAQNRRLGVHFQFERPLFSKDMKIKITEKNIQAFRKGIRDAKGIVGKEKKENQKPSYSQSSKKIASFKPSTFLKGLQSSFEPIFTPQLNEQVISETVGLRNLDFIDQSSIHENQVIQEENLLHLFSHPFDVLLLSANNVSEVIASICKLVRAGKIREDEIDKRALRILLIKMLLSG